MARAARPLAGLVSEVFREQTVLLTGHTGFKGSWLALWLEHLGARVHGLALPPSTDPSLYDRAQVGQRLAGESILDIRDGEALIERLVALRPRFVFHLAAQALVGESYRDPVGTLATNVMGTAHLLEGLRRADAPCAAVVVTSDKCYENVEQAKPFAESDPLGGIDPYSASKGATELVAASYRRALLAGGPVTVATARAGNVIGGGDWSEARLLPDVIAHLQRGEPVPLRNPGAIRPWQHVLEPLSGYLRLAERLADGPQPGCEAINFGPGPGGEATVQAVVERCIKLRGAGEWRDVSDPDAPHEAGVLRLAIDRAREQLGWTPRWDLETALAETLSWHEDLPDDPAAVRARCLAQIARFDAAAPGAPA